MKVLWLSNKVQSAKNQGGTGTWLEALAQELIRSGEVELGNISRGPVTKTTWQDFGSLRQWIVPASANPGPSGLPGQPYITELVRLTDEFAPDLIHVWGTEGYWGLLTARKWLKQPALLEMQGLKKAIAQYFHGSLSFKEQLACIGIKEILKRNSILQERKRFLAWGKKEEEMILAHDFISVQTDWIASQVRAINLSCQLFHSNRVLRRDFYTAEPWQSSNNPIIFCSSAYPAPFKGLHVAIRATALLKRYYPHIQLHIAGALQRSGLRQEGYIAWLNREVERLNLVSNVKWLGATSADEMVKEIQSSAVMLLPSFIENCSNFMQEGMLMGIPVVVSYAGGLPSLASDNESALFFPPGDEIMCAHQIKRILTERTFAERISSQARELALERNNYERVVQNQIEIYRQVLRISENKS